MNNNKAIALALMASTLAACTGNGTDSSSSQSSANTVSSTSVMASSLSSLSSLSSSSPAMLSSSSSSLVASSSSVAPNPQITLTLQENATGFCSAVFAGLVETEHTGYSGAGYANANNLAGAGITWQVMAQQATQAALAIRYANGATTARNGALALNDVAVSNLTFAPTAAWTDWQTVNVSINLVAGANEIRLEGVDATGLANIDQLSVAANGIGVGNCFGVPANGHHVAPTVVAQGGKAMEKLDRGLVAVKVSGGVYLSWRLMGTDVNDTAFNLYRDGNLVNGTPITGATNFTDSSGTTSSKYQVKPVVGGKELAADKTISVWAQQYLTLDLDRPAGGTSEDGVAYTYSPNDASVADLDGDGEYEIILKWDPSNSKDNSFSGYTGKVYIDAYKLSGKKLWRIDLGRNVRAGAHYVDFMVYDFDGDGKAEMAVKTADGTIDGKGKVIGNASADYRNSSGHVNTGPEFLTVFNGLDGAELKTIDYPNTRGSISDWGDTYGNRGNRFLAGVAYLDGINPSMIFTRGYYGPQNSSLRYQTKITALDWRNGQLTQRWQFHADSAGSNKEYLVQGAHSLSIADVDGDGRDEIIYGAATIDDNGKGLYSTGLCHGDALHVADIIPNRQGLEVFMVHEDPGCYGNYGVEVHDAKTGQILYSNDGTGVDVGRGVAGDIDASSPGMEVWASRGGLMKSTGAQQDTRPGPMNFMVWWDGDLTRELLDGSVDTGTDTKAYIGKWDAASGKVNNLLVGDTYGALTNNSTKSTPSLSADILGDWREEVIWRHNNNSQLLIFTTTVPTNERIYTLMHDAQYRVAVAWQNTGYNQPPHPSFFLGAGMAAAPKPNIHLVGETVQETTENILKIQEASAGYCSTLPTESTNGGFTGAGYVNTANAIDVTVDWAVNAKTAGTYNITVRYAAITDRPAQLLVNGAVAQSNVPFVSSGSWTVWKTQIIQANLSAGNNKITLKATGAEGLANIDVLEVWHTAAQPGNCN